MAINVPNKPPVSLVALAFVFVVVGVFTSPELLISLGPGRRALTSDNSLTRETAAFGLIGFRGLCFIVSVALFGVSICWRRFIASKFFNVMISHPNSYQTDNSRSKVFNISFYITFSAWLIGLFYLAFGGYLLPKSITIPFGKAEGYLEHLTALNFLISSVMFAITAWKYRGYKPTRFFLTLFALIFFVFVGEETSWGQWVFGFETMDLMKGVNVQDENNIHNMFGYLADWIFIVGTFIYGVALPVLRACYPFWEHVFAKIGLPIPSLGLAFAIIPISLTHYFTIGVLIESTVNLRIAELREFLVSIAFLMLAFECRAYLRQSRSPNQEEGQSSR